jgi:hypothetical protein
VLRRFEETYPLWSLRQFASHNRVDELTRPFLSFLNARYAIGGPGETAPPGWTVLVRSREGSTFENRVALPRAFVPGIVRVEPDGRKRIAEMSAATDFSQTAWLSEGVPGTSRNGAAALRVREVGADLVIDADVREKAFVATSVPDWPGWRAQSDGRAIRLATVNHAFVGFWLPPGRGVVRLQYSPDSFRFGVALAALAALTALVPVLRRRPRAIP